MDWGLGHTTRCIPLITTLLALGHQPVLAAEGRSAVLLRQAFPRIPIVPLRGYRVRYSRKGWWQTGKIALQIPAILRAIRHEHEWLKDIQACCSFDLVISDNRYGFYAPGTPSLFITHQLQIPVKPAWVCRQLQRLNYRYIGRFSSCAVPDNKSGLRLSGQLGHPANKPPFLVHYIGWLSRLRKVPVPATDIDYLFLLSGPEPQRTLLEEKLVALAAALPGKQCYMLRALPGQADPLPHLPSNLQTVAHAGTEALSTLIGRSKKIVSRSGYTTLMEMMLLGKKIICIPTPGQAEQEYLAQWLMEQGMAFCFPQHHPSYTRALEEAEKFEYRNPGPGTEPPEAFAQIIASLENADSLLPEAFAPIMYEAE